MGPGQPFDWLGKRVNGTAGDKPAAVEPDPAVSLAREREVFDLQNKRRTLLGAGANANSAPLGAPLGGAAGARLLGS